MANALYDKFKEALMKKLLDLTTDNIKVLAVNTVGGATQYTFSQAHEFHSDVAAGAIVATSGINLGSAAVVGKNFDGADMVPAFASLNGEQYEALIMYQDTGTSGTSRLMLFIDTATGLPLTPDGNNNNILWNASGIFDL